MFAIVRSGGKQYRVAPGDKIVVEKLAGEAGDTIDLTDILLAGDGSDLQSTAGMTVGARIIAQAKADKVTVFKKRRRHNYRRKQGHRQLHTILEIVSIGGKSKSAKPGTEKKADAPKAEKPAADPKAAAPAKADKPAKASPAKAKSTTDAAPAKAAAKKAAPKAAAKPKK